MPLRIPVEIQVDFVPRSLTTGICRRRRLPRVVQQLDRVSERRPLLGRKLTLGGAEVRRVRKARHPLGCRIDVREAGSATPVGHLAVADAAVTHALVKAMIRAEAAQCPAVERCLLTTPFADGAIERFDPTEMGTSIGAVRQAGLITA